MVEGEKGSRQASGSSGGAARPRPAVPADTAGDAERADDLTQLLASLGALLGSHAADDLVVMSREELERREFAAYGRGWRDAAARYEQWAEWISIVRVGETGDRTPGQAAVIPFRRREPYVGPGSGSPVIVYRDPYDGRADFRGDEQDMAGRTHPAVDRAGQDQNRPSVRTGPGQNRPSTRTGPDQSRPSARAGQDQGSPSARAGQGQGSPSARAGQDQNRPSAGTEPDQSRSSTRPDGSSHTRPAPPGTAGTAPAGPLLPSSGPRSRADVTPDAPSPSRPAFDPKSRRSKVPTIPRLPRRRDRPDAEA